jgi:hypothetical protein
MFVGAAALWGYKLDAVKHDGIRAALNARENEDVIEAEALAGVTGTIESLAGPESALAASLPVGAGE